MAKKGKYVYDWPRPMVTVDAAVFSFFKQAGSTRAKLLLIQRGNQPYKGQWALPGGFVELDEELETAAARELAEETGLKRVSRPTDFNSIYGNCTSGSKKNQSR